MSQRISLAVRQVVASTMLVAAFAAGADPGKAAGEEACVKQKVSECDAVYKKASARCDRYHIKGTEALPICHRSAKASRETCAKMGRKDCGGKP